MKNRRVLIIRVLTWVSIPLCIVGLVPIVTNTYGDYDDFEYGMFALGAAGIITGAIAAVRVKLVGTDVAEQRVALRSMGIDLGIAVAFTVAASYVVAFATRAIVDDPSLAYMSFIFAFVHVIGLCIGAVVGLLVLAPIVLIISVLISAAVGNEVRWGYFATGLLFLATVGTVISGVLAVEYPDGYQKGDGFLSLFIAITGRPAFDGYIVSPELAWVTRIGAVVVLALGMFLTLYGVETVRKRRNTTRILPAEAVANLGQR